MAGGAAAARRSAHTPPPPPVRHPPLGHPSKPGSHQSPPQPETRNPNPIWSSPERRCSSEKKRSPECSSEKKSCPAGSRRPPLGHVFRDGDGTLQYEVLGILAGPKDSPYSSLLPSALSSLIMVSLLPADLGGSGSEVEHNRQQQRTPKMPEVEGSTGTSPSV
uniref:Uncharacterized protein n=1 Tax=Setaria viridis TaxID=4556 RepID=A0A4U6T8E8_SETVI|nr:hypothetical protein SEVIR_9G540850v2 [Setaria viridis]